MDNIGQRPTEFEFVCNVPEVSGEVVGMVEHKGEIIVACQFRIYRLVDGALVPIKFKRG
jgi:hypothetical protein